MQQIRFSGNYFTFMNSYQAIFSQLDLLGGVLSYQDVTLEFLDKLPKSLSPFTHRLKVEVENAEENEVAVWAQVYDSVLDYLIDCELYDATKRQIIQSNNTERPYSVGRVQTALNMRVERTNSRQNTKRKTNKGFKCYHCGES